ncbi:Oidioi.mRNA.OKI2018_I69.XSR.g13751.t1.cds [Oikopleura dioica]|uniref:Oidioi.mRNA.OKI2018_I69.XSR.g13751.t1.cds n=1 Tax=Oikopleura dioica TaxID=34765 RepID=A0ABN7S7U0_OIKDI|nr:Oidioi.mRNA.OKI2018_I69.XSR.g13751.t1.cds [Oikopleura dioica]
MSGLFSEEQSVFGFSESGAHEQIGKVCLIISPRSVSSKVLRSEKSVIYVSLDQYRQQRRKQAQRLEINTFSLTTPTSSRPK